jgi:hypothetical protein
LDIGWQIFNKTAQPFIIAIKVIVISTKLLVQSY